MWLAAYVLLTAATSDIALGVATKPQQFLGAALPSLAKNKQGRTNSCADDSIFKDALDRLAYALFVEAPVNASPDVEYGRQVLESVSFGVQKASASKAASAPLKAATARLQNWWHAVARARRNTTGAKLLGAHSSLDHSQLLQSQVLPAACPADLPEDDPYWSQKDSYWVENTAYVECRYSDGCQKEFTNRERVDSLRRTLQATKTFLNAQNTTHMLFGGTVIGAYRCNDVLPWDLDTDVVILNDHFPKLLRLFVGTRRGTGFRGEGRSIDLANFDLPGFTLMEKAPGCLPLVIVDQSTGFFTDVFPMQPVSLDEVAAMSFSASPTLMYSPWPTGPMACDAWAMFNGCGMARCDYWSYANTLPASECKIHTTKQACPRDLKAFLHEYYGNSVDRPDIPIRDAASAMQLPA